MAEGRRNFGGGDWKTFFLSTYFVASRKHPYILAYFPIPTRSKRENTFYRAICRGNLEPRSETSQQF